MKIGDKIHVKRSCYLNNLGRWAEGALEVVELRATGVVVRKPNAESRWYVEHRDITIRKGEGTSASTRRAKRRHEGART